MSHHLKVLPNHDADAAWVAQLDAQFERAEQGAKEGVFLGVMIVQTEAELKRRAVESGVADKGGLKGWLAAKLPKRSYSAAMRCKTAAQNAVKVAKISGNVDLGWLLAATASQLGADLEAKRAKLEKLLSENSQRQLLLWGGRGDAQGAERKPEPRGPAREVKIEQETAEHFWNDWLVNTHREGMKETSWMHLQPSTIRRIAELAKDLASKVKAAT